MNFRYKEMNYSKLEPRYINLVRKNKKLKRELVRAQKALHLKDMVIGYLNLGFRLNITNYITKFAWNKYRIKL